MTPPSQMLSNITQIVDASLSVDDYTVTSTKEIETR